MTRTAKLEAELSIPIDTLLVDLGERFRARMTVTDALECERWAVERYEDVAAIRGYIRAIRALRAADCSHCDRTGRGYRYTMLGGRIRQARGSCPCAVCQPRGPR